MPIEVLYTGPMKAPILAAKLFKSGVRPEAVRRPQLLARLDEGRQRKLTLVSAPAGFGKTTLVSEWSSGCGQPAAWLSLDAGDNDPLRFLNYLVSSLQTISISVSDGLSGMLDSSQPPPLEYMLTMLLNEISLVPGHFSLVLDDWHAIDAKAVNDVLLFLLDHLPMMMHLVIVTREDPPLPLARLRARGQLTELRAADLRFSPAEAADFLNRAMGLSIPAEGIAALEARTEGWIAGLQLAAISMRGQQDTAGFIKSFTGSHRFILDYLAEEVLQRLPQRERSFLLQTSLLGSMCGSLCDAVTGLSGSGEMLEALERGNMFVVPLDERRQWYRYHHLFADVLQASAWYEQNGMLPEAIHHALATHDDEHAAELIQLAWPAAEEGSILPFTWLGWVKMLPDSLVRARPALNVCYAFALLGVGEMEAAEAKLSDAERWLDAADATAAHPETLQADISLGRAYIAQALGSIPDTVMHAHKVLELLPETDGLRRGQASMLLGLSHWSSGDLEKARQVFAGYTIKLRLAGNIPDAIGTSAVLSDITLALGHLREAIGTAEELLRFVTGKGEPAPPDTADLHRVLSELYLEQGNLQAAAVHLRKGLELGENAQLPVLRYRLRIASSRVKKAQGDPDGALADLVEAQRLFIRSPLPDTCPLPAMKARIWIAQGRLAECLGWVREVNLSAEDMPGYLREYEHITLARLLIAQSRSKRGVNPVHGIMDFLDRLLQAADEGKRVSSMIEILVLQALVYRAQGETAPAFISLGRALALAEPEGYARLFTDEGPPMERLLHEAHSRGITPAFTQRLTAAFLSVETPPPMPADQAASEQLSQREIEVLRHIAKGRTNREIAAQLFLSLNTVKVHTRNIFAKLDVSNRTQAAEKAREMGVLTSEGPAVHR